MRDMKCDKKHDYKKNSFKKNNKGLRLYSTSGVIAAAVLLNSLGTVLPDAVDVLGVGQKVSGLCLSVMPVEERVLPVESTAPEVYRQYFVADHQGHAAFRGYNALNQAAYVAALNEFAVVLPENVRLYNVLAPTSAAFDLAADVADEYESLFPDQQKIISEVYQQLDGRFSSVDIWDALAEHEGEYLYFRTDHHWTALAGYYAYAELGEVLGYQPYDLSELERVDCDVAFLGSIYQSTGSPQLLSAYDKLWYYRLPGAGSRVEYVYWDNSGRPKVSESATDGAYKKWYYRQNNKYAFFMGGDLPYIRLRSDAGTGRRLAVIKDSYANTILPLLAAHFDEIYVIDPRHSNYNALDIIRENGVTDVLFVNYARVVCLPEFSEGLLELARRDGAEPQPVK